MSHWNRIGSVPVVGLVLLWAPLVAAEPVTISGRRELPAVKLRGYGTVSGTFRPSEDGSAAVLTIRCQSEEKARLVQAKYLSDLGLLPGVARTGLLSGRGKIRVSEVAGRGYIAAVRVGPEVLIIAAPTHQALASLLEKQGPTGPGDLTSEAEALVPMYLDRWDRHGFRFYYAPWMRPRLPDGRDDDRYDTARDFAFARDSEQSGLVLWSEPNSFDTAAGITKLPEWDWALKRAQAMKLSVGINLSIGDSRWLLNRFPEQVIQRQPQYTGAWYGIVNYGVPDILAWCSPRAQDVQLAQMQKVMRAVAPCSDTITSWLEPHGELSHSPCDQLIDFGPDADSSFRAFLETRYAKIANVSRRYTGGEETLRSWEQVRVPELASFLGWGPEAVDLVGTWKLSYEAPFTASSAAPDLDDSSWPAIVAPGVTTSW